MSMKQVPLNEATDEQLREFATQTLGLEVHHFSKASSLIPKIKAIHSEDFITVSADGEADAAPAPQAAAATPDASTPKPEAPKMVRLMIQREDKAGGDRPVPVGVNGRIMLIPRGEPVDVPVAYAKVLGQAIQHIYDPMPDGGINPVPRAVPLYPHQILAA